jgi:hypothetical protein
MDGNKLLHIIFLPVALLLVGFYAEWQIIKDGQKCEHFLKVPHKAITGHNNEMIQGSVQQCEVACCARDWCKSFEYDAKSSRCNLADVDASRQFADTISSTTWNLYERTTMAKVPVSMGKSGCSTQLTQLVSTAPTKNIAQGNLDVATNINETAG